jgi:hypothetical protein
MEEIISTKSSQNSFHMIKLKTLKFWFWLLIKLFWFYALV